MESFTVPDINIRALEAAAHFASTDQARGCITNVAVFNSGGMDFFAGTNSYVLGVVTPVPEVSPLAIIKCLQAGDDYRTELVQVPAPLVHAAYRALPKRKLLTRTPTVSFDVVELNGTSPAGSYSVELTVAAEITWRQSEQMNPAEWPAIHNLFCQDEPMFVDSVSYDTRWLTVLGQATQLIDARGLLTYFGQKRGNDKQNGAMLCGYWYTTGEHGTLLSILMPMRTTEPRCWS